MMECERDDANSFASNTPELVFLQHDNRVRLGAIAIDWRVGATYSNL
jgi:hypothetical protein